MCFCITNPSTVEVKLECGYKRVPLKRGKASQTYIESAKEKKAAAAAAAKGDFIAADVGENRNSASSEADKDQPQLNQMNTNFSQFSLKGLSGFQPTTTEPSDTRNSSEPLFMDRSLSFHPETENPIIFSNTYEHPSNNSAVTKPDHPEFPASMDTPNLIFDQPMSPNAGWLFNLNTPFAEQSQAMPAGQDVKLESGSPNAAERPKAQYLPYMEKPRPIEGTETLDKLRLMMQPENPYNERYPQNFSQFPQMEDMVRQTPPPTETASSILTAPVPKEHKFPILLPVQHELAPISMSVAQDLLDSYFSHSTHVLAYLVRKSSVLSSTNPRPTSKALLFSFLLVAAHHSDNPVLTGAPSMRKNVIEQLTDLTINNLSTLHHITPKVTLDDVITYIQLGTVVSASEYKGYSLRFWAAAWALAKELKLNIERPELPEETREERRRTWWLLYMVDRHLGLCYNRPLAILDSEATSLYRPVEDRVWNSEAALTPAEHDPNRLKGLCHFVTGQDLFGYFLPLMTILGSLLELHHLQQNPIIQLGDVDRTLRPAIRTSLEQYTTSLKNWNPVPCNNIYENAWRDYAFQLSHVLFILALVPWDPLELINSPDSMMLSAEFNQALSHAISASKHIRRILNMDADLMLMPFFFGIYLLQSSFVLLFVVDRVEFEASHDVFAACETIVHAHEVCVVTLNTEYQRNFRRVMRGTINLLNSDNAAKNTPSSTASGSPMGSTGGLPMESKTMEEKLKKEKEEARQRRKDILGLYRWTSGGHGLAV